MNIVVCPDLNNVCLLIEFNKKTEKGHKNEILELFKCCKVYPIAYIWSNLGFERDNNI